MKAIAVACTLALTILAPAAHAGFTDGNDLYRDCTSGNYQKNALCMGYIRAISDTFEYMQSNYICMRRGVDTGQIVDVFTNYARAHPQHRDGNAAYIVSKALHNGFPCKKS